MKYLVPLLFLPALLTACSSGKEAASHGEGPQYKLRSNIPGTSLVRIDALPGVKPYGDNDDDYCGTRVAARTPAGKQAEQRGWRVVQELTYQGLDAILIVRGFDPGTSSHCFAKDPNLVFFTGETLIGVLYPKGKSAQGYPIGMNFMQIVGEHLRIWDDNTAVGQVNLKGMSLTFDTITGSDAFCKGRYQVPVLFGRPYSEARTTLGKAGWTIRPSPEDAGEDARTLDYRKRFPETDACSGTGYAYCRFSLPSRDGEAMLLVTTTGEDEDPAVSSYDVACSRADAARMFAQDGE